ncbi:MAG: xylulokinase [Clostridia bacterium]|nr:xylulokinase [Clostridia bacterium]
MNTYIGIDLGTSGVKLLLVAADGSILAETTEAYPVSYPKDGWSEQNPSDWLSAVKKGIKNLFDGGMYEAKDVKGVSFGGQMHGLVMLDKEGEVIRPAILWNDGRTQKQTDYLNEVIGKEKLSALTANIAFAGFTAPKILWVEENEPENFKRIDKICLPKDYLAYKMTGVFSSDYSDASGMLLLDVKNKCWSKEMAEVCHVKEEWLPKLYESYEVTGRVLGEYGLPSALVTAGAGDNAAAAIGTGTVKNGDANVSLGTSGTVFIAGDRFSVDKKNALHAFAHATGKWHLMGCILSAASANKWWIEDILSGDYALAVKGMEEKLGEGNVYFLPYLMGERSPHNDVNARGAFIGMRPDTTKEEMSLAVLEGVAFALKDCVEVALTNGIEVKKTKICGGGAKSELWKKIIANVLNAEVCSLETEQGPAYGGAILAMVGTGEYASVEEAAEKVVKVKSSVFPDSETARKYERKYRVFKELYPALKNAFALM